MKVALRIIIAALGGLCLLSLAALVAGAYFNSPPEGTPIGTPTGASSGSLVFEVEAGESAASVGRRLDDAGIIRSAAFWRVASRYYEARGGYLKAGVYELRLPAEQTAIYAALESGAEQLRRVTIPEGVTLQKMAAIFDQAGICPAAEFAAATSSSVLTRRYGIGGPTMEGYLFPDTYFFPKNYPAEKVAAALADNFFDKIAGLYDISSLKDGELRRKVILASIVEREYRAADEAPLIAGVFYKRLAVNMPLESCATVEYIITEIQGKPHPERIFTADTRIDNPYNTYVYRGLPPAPIAAPGLTALAAVFSPADTGDLFFRLVDADAGRHYFSKTFDEHISAGALLVKR
jgi:UPF0755 protein